MAVKAYTQTPLYSGVAHKFEWIGLNNADTCQSASIAFFPTKCIQVSGTFGASGTFGLQGSNDGGSNWAILNDVGGTAINNITAATAIRAIRESPQLIRPYLVSGGDGTTSVTISIVAVGNSQINY
jgi:hypothetical protein